MWTRILWLRCYVNNCVTGSGGKSHPICMMITDISNELTIKLRCTNKQQPPCIFLFIDRLLLKCLAYFNAYYVWKDISCMNELMLM